MTLQSSNNSVSVEKSNGSIGEGHGDVIIDIDSRTTTLVSKELEGMCSCYEQLYGSLTLKARPFTAEEIEHGISETMTAPCESSNDLPRNCTS
jgi:hypothetical protein